MYGLLPALDALEAWIVSPSEVRVSEGDGILAFGHLFEVVHVELYSGGWYLALEGLVVAGGEVERMHFNRKSFNIVNLHFASIRRPIDDFREFLT